MIHYTHPDLLGEEPARVLVAGAGGNGSQLLTRLARLHHALVKLGGAGLAVRVYDPDEVSEANVGRQMFAPGDVGRNKAIAGVHRINAWFGLNWEARPEKFNASGARADMVIVCVDSRAARHSVRQMLPNLQPAYLMDLGNRGSDGQVVLGQPGSTEKRRESRAVDHVALPHPYALFPELVNTKLAEDDAPSCSLAEALEKQELFVNDDVTTAAAAILWELFRKGRLTWHGAFVNASTGRRVPIAVDPEVWKRMSTTAAPKPRRVKK